MQGFYRDNKVYIDKLLFLVGFFVFAYMLLEYGLSYIAPFVAGYFISLVISPLVGFIQRKLKIARGISTIFLIVVIILLIAIAATSLFNRIVLETRYLSNRFPQYLDELRNFLINMESGFDVYMSFVPEEFSLDFGELINQLLALITSIAGDFALGASLGVVSSIPITVINVLLSLLSAFFFTRDKKIIAESITRNLPEWLQTSLSTIQKGFLAAIGGYLKAQLTIMSVIASISILGLTILRYPYAVIMGLVICLLDAIPMIGSGLMFWPWAVASLISGNFAFAVGLLVINAACFLSRQLLEPKVLGQQIGLHPLLVLIGIYIGLKVFGVFGLFLGPILLVIAKLILKTSTERDGSGPPKVSAVQRMVTNAGKRIKKNV